MEFTIQHLRQRAENHRHAPITLDYDEVQHLLKEAGLRGQHPAEAEVARLKAELEATQKVSDTWKEGWTDVTRFGLQVAALFGIAEGFKFDDALKQIEDELAKLNTELTTAKANFVASDNLVVKLQLQLAGAATAKSLAPGGSQIPDPRDPSKGENPVVDETAHLG